MRKDFFVLFNNSAISSWITYISNIQSITFVGPTNDYALFQQNMEHHYPHLLSNNYTRIRYINESHWIHTYKDKYRCPYPKVCQQLIKLHVFDLRTKLGLDYIGDNILIVDSDTVWSRKLASSIPMMVRLHILKFIMMHRKHAMEMTQ